MSNRFRSKVAKRQSKTSQTFTYRPLAFAIALAISGTLPSVAKAATYTVYNVADSGVDSLRAAVDLANANPGDDAIVFDLTAGSTITLASELSITESVTITGPTAGDAGSIILDGGASGGASIRHINAGGFASNSGQTITLENMTLTNGKYDGSHRTYSGYGGGSVYIKNANLILNSSVVSNNSTIGDFANGGGIFSYFGSVTLNQSTITGNSTAGNYADGGGLFIGIGASVLITDSTISNNSTVGDYADAGGILIRSGSGVIRQSTISGNSTKAKGGGLYIRNGYLTLTQSTVSDNTAIGTSGKGGGVYAQNSNTTINQSTIFLNSSTAGAGGISADMNTVNHGVTLTNSILSYNYSPVAGNFADTSSTSLGLLKVTNSVFGDSPASITDPSSSGNQFQNERHLLDLLDNGGPTFTHKPKSYSKAINNGSNAAATFTTNDQRGAGFARIIDGVVDIGAVELQSEGAITVVKTDDAGAGSLRQAVLDANNSIGPDVIEFAVTPGSTINLASELLITDSITISGPTSEDAGSLILDGGGTNRLINAGGFINGSGETITLENITLQNGYSASTGGSVYVKYADLVLNHSKISDNSTSTRGGGLYLFGGDHTFNQTTISGNSSAKGGGLYLRANGVLTLNQTTVSGNSATGIFSGDGGGLLSENSNITLNQSTLSGNQATGRGGGLYAYHSNLTLTQSTVADNQSASGAAGLTVRLNAGYRTVINTVSLTNSILSGNINNGPFAGEGNFTNLNFSSLVPNVTVSNSVFGDPVGEITDTANSANNQYTDSPDLGPLVDNGGPTFTHLPNVNSPALDMGNNIGAPATDQRGTGFNRTINTTVDIGSVERQTNTPNIVRNTNDSGAGSLRQAVLYTNSSASLNNIVFTGIPLNQTITLASELHITDSLTISGPTAGDAGSVILDGGGSNRHINAGGFLSNTGETITLENITLQNGFFDGTTASVNGGGGSVIVRHADLILNSSNITNNSTAGSAGDGGGLYIGLGDIVLNQTTISDNSTMGESAKGGGLFVRYGNATFNQSTLSGNSTTGDTARGGGLYAIYGDATFNQSTVSGNSTTGDDAKGGGLSFVAANVISNQSTISGNDTAGNLASGGGIYSLFGNLTLTQSTVIDNQSAVDAAGISVKLLLSNYAVSLTNSILSGNTNTGAGTGGNFYDIAALTSPNVTVINSVFGDDPSEITDTVNSGNNVFDNLPKLGPLQNNGGPTLTRLPNEGSPALDAGATPALTEDQRGNGFPRIINAVVDIGATESPILHNKNGAVTRAEIVKPILQAALIESNSAYFPYYDVGMNSYNADWIESFKRNGFAQECAPNRFCPAEIVSKGELALMISNVKVLPLLSYQGLYSDVPNNHPYALEIEALSVAGFATDCATGRYCPNEVLTHDSFNAILIKAYR